MRQLMHRRGFALITVLWLVALLGTLAAGLLQVVRREQRVTENRVALTRGRWAQDACLAILEARYAEHADVRAVDTIDLGRGTWCRVRVVDLASRVNINTAPRAILAAVLGSDSLADAVERWKNRWPDSTAFGSVAALRLVPGFEAVSESWLDSNFTVEGDGRLNPNLVPPRVLEALPGLDAEAVHAILIGPPVSGLDQLGGRISSASRRNLASAYQTLSAALTFQPAWLEARVEGGVRGMRATAEARVLLVPLESRLAMVARVPW